jgi:uncharacterized membrane protein YkgB
MPTTGGFAGRGRSGRDARLSPGQYDAGDGRPALHVEATPSTATHSWRFTVDGSADTPATWTWDEIRAPPIPTLINIADTPDGELIVMDIRHVRKIAQDTGISTIRYGLVINLLEIGRIKFEDYEVENIRPLVTSSPPFSWLIAKLGEKKVAKLIGATEIGLGLLIGAKPVAPRASALGSLAAVGMFAATLSFLATTPGAWQETRGEPKLSLTGQFLVKDVVLLGACLLTAADALQAAERR